MDHHNSERVLKGAFVRTTAKLSRITQPPRYYERGTAELARSLAPEQRGSEEQALYS